MAAKAGGIILAETHQEKIKVCHEFPRMICFNRMQARHTGSLKELSEFCPVLYLVGSSLHALSGRALTVLPTITSYIGRLSLSSVCYVRLKHGGARARVVSSSVSWASLAVTGEPVEPKINVLG
jgi:hypothetical protein